MFYYASINNETTKLVTPEFDISYAIKPELVFWHAQIDKLYAGYGFEVSASLYNR